MKTSMDVRVHPKRFRQAQRLYAASQFDPQFVTLNEDSTIAPAMGAVIVIWEDDRAIRWTSGWPNVSSYLRTGTVSIRRICPYRCLFGIIQRKCLGEKCQLSVLRNSTRDCAHVWMVMK